MTKLVLNVSNDMARSLERIAALQAKTVQQFAVESLRSLVEGNLNPAPGSAEAVLRAMSASPHNSAADVDELDAAIAAGRLPNKNS